MVKAVVWFTCLVKRVGVVHGIGKKTYHICPHTIFGNGKNSLKTLVKARFCKITLRSEDKASTQACISMDFAKTIAC